MKSESVTPYVISADIRQPMQRWGERFHYSTPDFNIYDDLLLEMQQEMKPWFPDGIEVIQEEEMRNWMTGKVQQTRLPVISLDRFYLDPDKFPTIVGTVDATRVVNDKFEDLALMARPGHPSLDKQIYTCVQRALNTGISEVALLDDVIFSGKTHSSLIHQLRSFGLHVTKLYAGISVLEGQKIVEKEGVDVDSFSSYDNVFDEVCERDFFAGTPNSGRVIVFQSLNGEIINWTSAPYFAPFGNPTKWASIPEDKVKDYSDMCFSHSIYLWSQVENRSNKTLPIGDLPRKLRVNGYTEDVSIVTALKDMKAEVRII